MRPAGFYSRPSAAHRAGDAVSAYGDAPARKSERFAALSDRNSEDAIWSVLTARASSLFAPCLVYVRIDHFAFAQPHREIEQRWTS